MRPEAGADDGSELEAVRPPLDGVVDIAGAAVRRTPAVLGSGIVVLAVFTLAFAATWLPVLLVAVVGGAGSIRFANEKLHESGERFAKETSYFEINSILPKLQRC